jgi:uncharacterized protein YukE
MALGYRYKVLFGGLGILGGVFAVYALSVSGRFELPTDFYEARKEVALASQRIVDLTRATNEKINAVNISDFSGNSDAAFSFITEAQKSNAEAYNQAVELSRHLKKLAESLNEIKSVESQRIAYEAVAIEFGLVSEFIVYTQKLSAFLENLAKAIATDLPRDRKRVEDSLAEVNLAVNYINQLNREFNKKFEEFERSL